MHMLSRRSHERLLALLVAGERPTRGLQLLRAETVVASDVERSFAFFSDAANLERLTPSWINFQIRTPLPIEMREGAIIDYQISLYGVPVPWRTRIEVWEPGVRFVDRQVAGPYRWWRHEHRFEAVDGGTRVVDEVEFVPRVPSLTMRLVSRDVDRIFAFRRQALASLLAPTAVTP